LLVRKEPPCGWAALATFYLALVCFCLPNLNEALKDDTQENYNNNNYKGQAVNVFHNSPDDKV